VRITGVNGINGPSIVDQHLVATAEHARHSCPGSAASRERLLSPSNHPATLAQGKTHCRHLLPGMVRAIPLFTCPLSDLPILRRLPLFVSAMFQSKNSVP
jgi:hypothetical protein